MDFPASATESQLHLSVAEFLGWCLIPPTFFTTFPAGYGKLGKATAGNLKARGMKKGMPDILIFKSTGFGDMTKAIGIELKAGNGSLTSSQREVHAQLLAVGVRCYVARSIEDVIRILDGVGIPYRNSKIWSQMTIRPDQLMPPV